MTDYEYVSNMRVACLFSGRRGDSRQRNGWEYHH